MEVSEGVLDVCDGGQGVSGEVWVRGGGSVPISDERYPAVGSGTPPGRYTPMGSLSPLLRPRVLALLSILIVSCGASPDLGFGLIDKCLLVVVCGTLTV